MLEPERQLVVWEKVNSQHRNMLCLQRKWLVFGALMCVSGLLLVGKFVLQTIISRKEKDQNGDEEAGIKLINPETGERQENTCAVEEEPQGGEASGDTNLVKFVFVLGRCMLMSLNVQLLIGLLYFSLPTGLSKEEKMNGVLDMLIVGKIYVMIYVAADSLRLKFATKMYYVSYFFVVIFEAVAITKDSCSAYSFLNWAIFVSSSCLAYFASHVYLIYICDEGHSPLEFESLQYGMLVAMNGLLVIVGALI
ncbi:hypothetical protein C0J52_15644 [Blattella germanica]|nr:hypothetical protein C0J52_15644 [Blattella germanica]